jgi:hypothetical protein
MSSKMWVIPLLLLVSTLLTAQSEESMRRRTMEGTQFPNLKAENLTGRDISLPQDGGSRATILFVAFRRKTQEQIDDWSDALRYSRDSTPVCSHLLR